jgi:hypothetical protein
MACRIAIPGRRSNLTGQPLPNQKPASFNEFLCVQFRVSAVVSDEDRFKVWRDSDGLSTAVLCAKSYLAADVISLVPTIGALAVEWKLDNVEFVAWPRSFIREEEGNSVSSDSTPPASSVLLLLNHD